MFLKRKPRTMLETSRNHPVSLACRDIISREVPSLAEKRVCWRVGYYEMWQRTLLFETKWCFQSPSLLLSSCCWDKTPWPRRLIQRGVYFVSAFSNGKTPSRWGGMAVRSRQSDRSGQLRAQAFRWKHKAEKGGGGVRLQAIKAPTPVTYFLQEDCTF